MNHVEAPFSLFGVWAVQNMAAVARKKPDFEGLHATLCPEQHAGFRKKKEKKKKYGCS